MNQPDQYMYGTQINNSGSQIDQNSRTISHDQASNFDLSQNSSKQHTPPKNQ